MLHFINWGGGGWGDAPERDPKLVAKEIHQGLVTVAGALRYGIVIVDGEVDAAATEALRTNMRGKRLAVLPVLDHGGYIETLRANCLAEIGLPASKQPIWHAKFAIAAE